MFRNKFEHYILKKNQWDKYNSGIKINYSQLSVLTERFSLIHQEKSRERSILALSSSSLLYKAENTQS